MAIVSQRELALKKKPTIWHIRNNERVGEGKKISVVIDELLCSALTAYIKKNTHEPKNWEEMHENTVKHIIHPSKRFI